MSPYDIPEWMLALIARVMEHEDQHEFKVNCMDKELSAVPEEFKVAAEAYRRFVKDLGSAS